MEPDKIDPSKLNMDQVKGILGLVAAAGTVVAAPFKVFATNGWVKNVEKKADRNRELIDQLLRETAKKDDIDGVEERLQQAIHANHAENRRTLADAVARLDSFIDTVSLLKDARKDNKTETHDAPK